VEDALFTAFGTRQVSTIYAPTDQYRVIMELRPEDQRDPAALSKLYIRSSNGNLVPLEVTSKLVPGVGVTTVNHVGQLSRGDDLLQPRPGAALSEAVDAVQREARQVLPRRSRPASRDGPGFQSSSKGLGWLLLWPCSSSTSCSGILTRASSTR
jgi:HAE1 family hydrophobic/amphiphilic exporter-1